MSVFKKILLLLAIIGGINWGIYGIWGFNAVGWLLGERFMLDRLEPSPIFQYDHHYSFDKSRHPMRYVYHIQRDELFADLFEKLPKLGQ